jgi:peptide/nickel transport system permease protein
MRSYAKYLAQRLTQCLLVVFIGINLTYVITHATPIDPVEQSIAAVTSFGNTSPEAIALMRSSLRELYGLNGGPLEQYVNFWRHVAVGLSHARVGADRARPSVDHRAAGDGNAADLGAG